MEVIPTSAKILLRKMLARRKYAGVGRLGRDLEEVAAGHTGKGLGKLRGLAAGGKIGN